MTSEQILAARAMLRWRQKDLAEKSGVSVSTIKNIEKKPGSLKSPRPIEDAIQRALESGGLGFDEHVMVWLSTLSGEEFLEYMSS